MGLEMTVGICGRMTEEAMIKQPEIQKALQRGGVIGAYVLNGEVLVNGIGVWEQIENENI